MLKLKERSHVLNCLKNRYIYSLFNSNKFIYFNILTWKKKSVFSICGSLTVAYILKQLETSTLIGDSALKKLFMTSLGTLFSQQISILLRKNKLTLLRKMKIP